GMITLRIPLGDKLRSSEQIPEEPFKSSSICHSERNEESLAWGVYSQEIPRFSRNDITQRVQSRANKLSEQILEEPKKSAIRNPQSAIPNPQSTIRNPQSPIRNPSAIRNPQSAIRNSSPLTH
ncbi:MAG: hypothetical protein ACPGWR_33515, partial [Ardenticatenaceae bacterium]